MEILPFCGRITTQMRIGRAEAFAEVVDMPQQMPLRVLRTRAPKISANAPISRRALGDRPILDGHTAQQHKPTTVEHFVAQPVQDRPERRQREVLAADLGDVEAASSRRPYCG